jgi:hypothetical protein
LLLANPSSGAMVFSFDTAGRFYQEQYPDGKTVTHVLDGNGNRTRTTWPDSYFVDRESFDEMNRLTEHQAERQRDQRSCHVHVQSSCRSALRLAYSNGATVVYTPQLNEDVTTITHSFVGSSVVFTYGFNAVHEPTQRACVGQTLTCIHPACSQHHVRDCGQRQQVPNRWRNKLQL